MITNSPIMLDETGVMLINELQHQNGYLSMIASGAQQEIFDSMAQIAGIIRGNDVETNARIFPIGDQIVMPWKDLDDPNHNTDATAYQVAWDIVHHGIVTRADGSEVPGMYLQMHKCSAYGVQFSHQQAFYQAAAVLSAGTYHVEFGVKYNDTFTAGTSGQFTLTQDLPKGGRLLLNGNNVEAWASATAASATETVALTLGSGGTSLGTISSGSSGGINAMNRIKYGHNRWSTSGIRQYLNSSKASWFASEEDFDMRPDENTKRGFMAGFNSDFLSAIRPVKVTTALNIEEGYASTTEDTVDTFFLPSLQQMNIRPMLSNVEGDTFDYWKQALGSQTFVESGVANTFDAFKIPSINDMANSGSYIWLRSAVRDEMHKGWHLNPSGYASFVHDVYNSFWFTPVCVVC